MNKEHRKAIISVLLGSSLISFSAVFARQSEMGPAITGFYRMAFAIIPLLALALHSGQTLPKNKKALLPIFIAGTCFAFDLAFWHACIPYVGVGLATLLNNLQVLFVILWAVALGGEHFSAFRLISVFLSLCGLYALSLSAKGLSDSDYLNLWRGLALGILSAGFYAGTLISLRSKHVSSANNTQFINLTLLATIAAAFLGLDAYCTGETFIIPNPRAFVKLLAYSFLCQVIAWYLISQALPKVGQGLGAMLLLSQPCLSYIWDIAFFGKTLSHIELVGVLAILLAVYLDANVQTIMQRFTSRGSLKFFPSRIKDVSRNVLE